MSEWNPPGYSVVLVPVPALEPAVRPPLERWAPDYLMLDGAINAHITVLGPFLADPLPALPRLRELLSRVAPFELALEALARFDDSGLVYAVPSPPAPWRHLTQLLADEWPQCPPYGGQFGEVVPHLSIDYADDIQTVAPTVAALLPATMTVTEVILAWYEPRATRHLASCRLGSAVGVAGSRTLPRP